MGRQVLAPKFSTQAKRYVIDFSNEIPTGLSISSASVTNSLYSATEASSTLTAAVLSFDSTSVTISVGGGQAGAIYDLKVTASISDVVAEKHCLLAITPGGI